MELSGNQPVHTSAAQLQVVVLGGGACQPQLVSDVLVIQTAFNAQTGLSVHLDLTAVPGPSADAAGEAVLDTPGCRVTLSYKEFELLKTTQKK